ncbi:hypothetical protein MYAM1_003454 [Malassezia yamatoensis]|uniref:Uncharacterized protein n=1 Tax=Malassezia yamatoensis TaxID=253288 RepID=A0AAJ5YXV0_9BASI|nr:hypothetical protein MYAM1_003454 [Malassezia yamatoensis]
MFGLKTLISVAVTLALAASTSAAPQELARRASPSKTVWVSSSSDHCMILPKTRESIGDSEHPGGMRSFCTKPYSSSQGKLNSGFWSEVHFKKTKKYAQLTGCINPKVQSTLLSNDDGGQYDSNGGDGGKGNPAGSVCLGYASYVEIVEPKARRACIRCCVNPNDCDISHDEDGCESVIPGNYC